VYYDKYVDVLRDIYYYVYDECVDARFIYDKNAYDKYVDVYDLS
jgi:hypothetical protein